MIQLDAKHPPTPRVVKMRWPVLMVWLIPVAAVGVAGYYVYAYLQDHGTQITVRFNDGDGLRPGQTMVVHLGVQIGQVEEIELSPDQKQVLVHIRLLRNAEAFAKKGTLFWVIRPELTLSSISGLGTIVSGPVIDSSPGDGDRVSEFIGLEHAPAALEPGLTITLHAVRFQRLQPDSAVYYRGFQVGVVQSIQLSDDAAGVKIQVFVNRRYAPLVRSTSIFWFVSGFDVKGGILTGIQMKLESLRSVLAGGLAFATPEKNIGEPAADGADFPVYEEPQPEWSNWAPRIALPPDETPADQKPPGSPLTQIMASPAGK